MSAEGCIFMLIFVILLVLCAMGLINPGKPPFGTKVAGPNQPALGALPALSTTKTAPATVATTAPAAVAATAPPVVETSPPQQQGSGPAQAPQQQAPAQPPPTSPPLPSCGFGNGISVSGGNPSTLGSGGGSFTVTAIPVTISVSGVPPCGKHYRLEYSGGGAKGSYNGLSACTFDGPSVTINSQFMSVGDTVSVTFQIPPNSCGD
jgi:hypothetical protein